MQRHLKTRPMQGAETSISSGITAALLLAPDPDKATKWNEQLRAAARALGLRLRVKSAHNVQDACEWLKHHAIDVVLLDLTVAAAIDREALRRAVALVAAHAFEPKALRRALSFARERQQWKRLRRMERTAAAAKLRLELIAETGRILATTPDTAAALGRVAAHIVPAGADCFLLCLFRKEDRVPLVRMQHIDRERVPMMVQSTQSLLSSPGPNLDRAAKVRYAREIATEGEDGHASARLLEILGMTNGVTVVMQTAGRSRGLLVLATAARRRGAAANVDFSRALGDAIGFALQKSSLTKRTERAVKACEGALNIVSHDLRNPLSTIQICARALLDPQPAPLSGMRNMAEIIQRSASWMETILQDLVDRANLEAGHLALARKKIAVGDLLAAAQVMFTPIAQERSIHFMVQGSAELPAIFGDPHRILQVLSNLLSNALKFTPTSGTVVLSAELDPGGASSDSSWRCGDVRFAVSDTGPGIPDQDLDRIFDWFWQSTQRSRGSAGLGLAIAKGLVEAHGRRLHVQSAPGQGSTFWFTMPAG